MASIRAPRGLLIGPPPSTAPSLSDGSARRRARRLFLAALEARAICRLARGRGAAAWRIFRGILLVARGLVQELPRNRKVACLGGKVQRSLLD